MLCGIGLPQALVQSMAEEYWENHISILLFLIRWHQTLDGLTLPGSDDRAISMRQALALWCGVENNAGYPKIAVILHGNMMFKTIKFFGVSHNFKAKPIFPTADSFVTEEIYDVINLVDHMIRLAVALAGLGMVHPSELFSVRFDSFWLLVAKKRGHSGVLNFGTLEAPWSFAFANLRAGLQYADLLGALHVCPGGDWSNLAIFHTCRQKRPLKWQLRMRMHEQGAAVRRFRRWVGGLSVGSFLECKKNW